MYMVQCLVRVRSYKPLQELDLQVDVVSDSGQHSQVLERIVTQFQYSQVERVRDGLSVSCRFIGVKSNTYGCHNVSESDSQGGLPSIIKGAFDRVAVIKGDNKFP